MTQVCYRRRTCACPFVSVPTLFTPAGVNRWLQGLAAPTSSTVRLPRPSVCAAARLSHHRPSSVHHYRTVRLPRPSVSAAVRLLPPPVLRPRCSSPPSARLRGCPPPASARLRRRRLRPQQTPRRRSDVSRGVANSQIPEQGGPPSFCTRRKYCSAERECLEAIEADWHLNYTVSSYLNENLHAQADSIPVDQQAGGATDERQNPSTEARADQKTLQDDRTELPMRQDGTEIARRSIKL